MSSLWYFGYGSNMSSATFLERRKMTPSQTVVARLGGYRLCFDIPVGPGERAVANLSVDPQGEVWGVAYEITPEDFDRLDQTEGVHAGVYKRISVDLATHGGENVAAFTYQSKISVIGRKPSARYMGLLLAGARENGLPPAYVQYLEAIELGRDEREAAVPDL